MDLSFPIFEIVIQELEEEAKYSRPLQPVMPLCYDSQSWRETNFYRYIIFTQEKVGIVAF